MRHTKAGGVQRAFTNRAALIVVTCGLSLNIGAGLWLVGRLGIEGAALATFATELFVTLASLGILLGVRGPTRGRNG